jgi:hypothetical protein
MRDVSPGLVGVVGASCLMAGWLLGSTVNPPVAHMQAPPAPRASEPPLPRLDIPSVAERRGRLAAVSEAPSPGRNPFAFGHARVVAPRHEAPIAPAMVIEAPIPPEVPVLPPPPAWTLVGVAMDQVGGEERVTAILSNGADVQLATVGAMLAGGYTVVRVAPDHAALVDASGAETIVRLP